MMVNILLIIYILIINNLFFFKEHCFASASTTGLLNIWDASQLAMISQFKIHNATINRLQFHPTSKKISNRQKKHPQPFFSDTNFRSQIIINSISRWIRKG